MRRNWPFFKDSDWLILVFVHSAKPTAELENLAMSPSLSSPGLSYDTKFVHIGWELRSSLVGDTILGVQSEPACINIIQKKIKINIKQETQPRGAGFRTRELFLDCLTVLNPCATPA